MENYPANRLQNYFFFVKFPLPAYSYCGPGRSALVRSLPFFIFLGMLALRSLLEARPLALPLLSNTQHLYLFQAALPLLALIVWRRDYQELWSIPTDPLRLLIAVAAGTLVFAIWILPGPAWMHLEASATHFVPVASDGAIQWEWVFVRSFGAVMVVPIIEELFWRSFLLRWVDRRQFQSLSPAAVSWTALLVSSGTFALGHELWLAALIAGLAYALLYRALQNLWYPVLAHATTNLALAIWVVRQGAWQFW